MQIILPGEIFSEHSSLDYKSSLINKITVNKENDQSTNNNFLISKVSGKIFQKTNTKEMALKFFQISEKYSPSQQDRIIGRIVKKQADNYEVDIRADRKGLLGVLSFQGASKKSRPNLIESDLVFARVQLIPEYLYYKLTCTSETNLKTWNSGESLFGSLNDGAEIVIPIFFAHFLLKNEIFFELIRKYIAIEIAIGVNGVLWIKTSSIKNLLILVNFFQQAPYLFKAKAVELLHNQMANFG